MAEDAVFSFIQDRLLSYANIDDVVNQVKSELETGDDEIDDLTQRLKKIECEVDKFVDLYSDEIIDKNDLRRKTGPLKEQKQAIEARIKEQMGSHAVLQVSTDVIYIE